MHATAPSSNLEPQEGQVVGNGKAPEPGRRAPLPPAGAAAGRDAGLGAPAAGAAGALAAAATGWGGAGGADGTPGITNGCLHDGQARRLPPALSGPCIDFWPCRQ